MTDFFYLIDKIPQCFDKKSKTKTNILMQFSLLVFYCTKSIKFHFEWGTKLLDQNQETGHDCDVSRFCTPPGTEI